MTVGPGVLRFMGWQRVKYDSVTKHKCICKYMCVCVCVCVYIYIYIYSIYTVVVVHCSMVATSQM